jgi:hypothetical protein
MTGLHKGGCLCGAVTFRVTGAFDAFFLCHCSRCRKGSGSVHASNLFSATATIEWLTGEAQVRGYSVPGTRHVRSFCVTCGSALPWHEDSGALLGVPAGSLDTEINVKPTAHIYLASRASWEDGLEDAPRMDGLPGE